MLIRSISNEYLGCLPQLCEITTDGDSCASAPAADHAPKTTLATAQKQNKISQRRCIVTKDSAEKSVLIRFVLSPDNIVTPDLDEELPGRGVWVSAERALIQQAIDQKLFHKAFKVNVTVPDALVDLIASMLNKRTLNMLNFARRAGDAIIGFDKVQSACRKLSIPVYITSSAEDADARRKIQNLLPKGAEIITIWDTDSLSTNFGTENTNHVVLKQSGITNKFLKDYRKLRSFGV